MTTADVAAVQTVRAVVKGLTCLTCSTGHMEQRNAQSTSITVVTVQCATRHRSSEQGFSDAELSLPRMFGEVNPCCIQGQKAGRVETEAAKSAIEAPGATGQRCQSGHTSAHGD